MINSTFGPKNRALRKKFICKKYDIGDIRKILLKDYNKSYLHIDQGVYPYHIACKLVHALATA